MTLIDRLLDRAYSGVGTDRLCEEAATEIRQMRHELKACQEMLAAARAELAKADAAVERGSCQSNCCRRCDNAAKAIIADCLKWTPKGGKDDGSD